MLYAIAVLMVGANTMVAGTSVPLELEVRLSPLKQSYAAGEPVAVELHLRNSSSDTLQVVASYPRHLGLTFASSDPAVAPRAGLRAVNERIPSISLRPGEEYTAVFALDRYLSFKQDSNRLRQHTIRYSAEYSEPVASGKPSPRSFRTTGQFSFELRPDPLPTDYVLRLGKELESRDKQKVREAAEFLLWVRDPSVIGRLEHAARLLPETCPDITEALRKFLPSDRGRAALLTILRLADTEGLKAGLQVCAECGVSVPDEVYRSLLGSKDVGTRYATLEHLVRHAGAAQLPLVKPLQDDPDNSVKKLAAEFVGRIEKR